MNKNIVKRGARSMFVLYIKIITGIVGGIGYNLKSWRFIKYGLAIT